MPIEQKRFGGIMNLDDKPDFILANQHIDALNLRFYGGANGLTAENIAGNTLISNTLPAGDNQAIGSFYDGLKQRIFWFNWNSNGRNGIYQYDINANTITPLLISFTDSASDIFNFSLDYPIPSVNIVYTTEEDGDILTWTDRLNRPKELNIKDAINNLFGSSWISEYLDVAKMPPSIPIKCAYENDNASIVNNLKGAGGYKLYRFKYRFVYGTFQKSTWSSISIMPIPFKYTDQAVDTDPTKNCTIGLIFQTGGADVVKIEIAAQENLGDVWSNFFSVQILNKAQLSIPSDDTYIWNFYNNEAYNYIDSGESVLLFDYVPDLANTQELLNGNVLVYGGITEGLDPVVPNVTLTVNTQQTSRQNVSLGLQASQQGLNGLSTGDIRISIVGLVSWAILAGNQSSIVVQVFNGATTDNLQAFATSGATTVADLITQLSVAATGAGYTVVSTTGNSIVIRRVNQVLLNFNVEGNGDILKPVNESINATDFSSKENYGIAYFADKYKTNGVTTNSQFGVQIFPVNFPLTNPQRVDISYVNMLIYGSPPSWAKYYQVVRTNNLTKTDYVTWVSDRTFKNDDYAFISIESINVYKVQNPTSVISYDFLVGDRIKFICLLNNDKTINTAYGNTRDYEIVGQLVNPNINGLVQSGQFLKIKLPTTTGTFDFGSFINNSFYYYEIELYTPAKSVANNLNVYYEFSEMFAIGDVGLPTAFHQGDTLNQDINTATPASIHLRNGDAYYRLREIRAGAFFIADSVPDVTYSWTNEPVLQQNIEVIPVGTSYTVKNTVGGSTSNLNNWLIKAGLTAVTFEAKGKLLFQALSTTTNVLRIQFQVKNAGGVVTSLTTIGSITGASNGQVLQFDITGTLTIPASSTGVIYLAETPVGSPAFSAKSVSGQISFIDTEHDFTIGVIDPNFSDFFASKVNSNGRELVVNADEKTLFYSTLLRWGLSYQQNTNINQINRFFPANFDEIDRSKGDIQRFVTVDRILRVFQNRACGQFGVLARFIENNDGNSQLVTTNDILTKGNINYYAGEFGLGDQYCSLVISNTVQYFVDPVTGYQVRLSNDGLKPISELYKGQYTIRDLLTPYNKTHLRADGSKAKIIGVYDFFDEQYICALQQAVDLSPNTFSFNEKRNGYCSFYSYYPEWITSAEDKIYTWLNGQLWKHDNTTNRCNFYGVQYDASITLVFNVNLLEKKTWESITEIASAIWASPLIYGNVYSYQGQLQESMLGEYDFANLEANFHAAILRDQHSIGGILNGDVIKGNYLVVKLLKQNASDLIWLSEVSMMFKDSPLTNK